MQLLCSITDWQDAEATVGKAKGNKTRIRTVVAADLWNWCIGTQRGGSEDSPIASYAFVGSIRMLFNYVEKHYEITAADNAANSVHAALIKYTGTKVNVRSNGESLDAFGKRIDDALQTSYSRDSSYPPKVLKRIFKVEEADKETKDTQEDE